MASNKRGLRKCVEPCKCQLVHSPKKEKPLTQNEDKLARPKKDVGKTIEIMIMP
jgi:hypothetical protein